MKFQRHRKLRGYPASEITTWTCAKIGRLCGPSSFSRLSAGGKKTASRAPAATRQAAPLRIRSRRADLKHASKKEELFELPAPERKRRMDSQELIRNSIRSLHHPASVANPSPTCPARFFFTTVHNLAASSQTLNWTSRSQISKTCLMQTR